MQFKRSGASESELYSKIVDIVHVDMMNVLSRLALK